MNIKLNTKEKTIVLLEECKFIELKDFLGKFEDYVDYKIVTEIQTIDYKPNPYVPTWTTISGTDVTYTTSN
jgi:hypothetical protein